MAVRKGFPKHRRCISADLSKNGVGPKGTAQLCQALTHNQTLQTLLLDTNNLGDEGAEQVASILASESHLKPIFAAMIAPSIQALASSITGST